jgi:hypothetical protein
MSSNTQFQDIIAWRDCTYTFTLDSEASPVNSLSEIIVTAHENGHTAISHEIIQVESRHSAKAPASHHHHSSSADSSSTTTSDYNPLIYKKLAETLEADANLSEIATHLPHPVHNPIVSAIS